MTISAAVPAEIAEREHDRPSKAEPYRARALEQIVENLLGGQHPESGKPSLRLIDLIPDEFIFSSWLDMVTQHKDEAQAAEVSSVRARLEEMLKDMLADDYRVGFLAEDMAVQAEADRDDE